MRKPKLLFIAYRYPDPPLRGDQVRSRGFIKELSSFFDVSFAYFTDEGEHKDPSHGYVRYYKLEHASQGRFIYNMVRSLRSKTPLQANFFLTTKAYEEIRNLVRKHDIVLGQTIRMGELLKEAALLGRHTRIILDFVDALSLNMLERAEVSPTPLKSFLKIESNLIRRYEEDLLKLIDKGFVISLRDKLYLGQVNKIKLIPNGVDLDRFPYLWEPKNEGYIVFLGRMNYPPNEDAVSYFVEQILPIIQKKRPETRFLIVGADPSRKVRTLSRKARGVQVLGFVPDVVPYLKAASVFVAPLRRATGLQNKVLEAMAVGVPVIASPKVVQGLGEESSTCLLTAENADDFAEKTLTILSDPVLSLKLSRAAREFVQERFDWKLIGKALIDELLS